MQKKMERKKDIELLFRQHYRPLCLFALHLINDVASAEEQACIEAKVWTALDSLPPKCREIFLMSKRDGMSYLEIAEELQLSVKTVEAQITKAYKRLREYTQRFYHFLLSFF